MLVNRPSRVDFPERQAKNDADEVKREMWMIRKIAVFLTLVSMLLHAVLGCHWHHQACAAQTASGASCTHESDAGCREDHDQNHESPTDDGDQDQGCPCRHEQPASDDSEDKPTDEPKKDNDKHDHQNGPCNEGSCSFVVPPKPESQTVCLTLSLDAAIAMLAQPATSTSAPTILTRSLPASFFGCPMSVRAHLVKQIWLL